MRQAEKELAAITGFTSAIAAFGAFFIPKAYGTSIDLTGGVEAALWGFLIFYVTCVVITWGFYTRRAACSTTSSIACRRWLSPRRSRRNKGRRPMSHFLDRLTFFKRTGETFSDGHGVMTDEDRALGGRLSQALAARQDRALDAWRELHRLVFVEDLCQGRHRHLGDPADRLSAHAPGPAEPRAARLLARRQLLAGISIPAIA